MPVPVWARAGPIGELYVLVVVNEDADEDAGAAQGRVLPPLARVLHRLVRGLEQQALLRIDVRGFARRDPEEARVELIDPGEETARGVRRCVPRRPDLRRRARRRPTGSAGTSRMASPPLQRKSQNWPGLSIPPGKRHPMPTMAIDSGSASRRPVVDGRNSGVMRCSESNVGIIRACKPIRGLYHRTTSARGDLHARRSRFCLVEEGTLCVSGPIDSAGPWARSRV